MINAVKPKRLVSGATIGVVSPAYWMEPEKLQRAVQYFTGLGFNVVLGESNQLRENIYAGSPEARAADIMKMFQDQSIDAIICCRGGYGGNRVLPLLDYEVIRNNPKIFIGFSDITGFLSSMAQRSGLVCFHGPMMTNYGNEPFQYNLDSFLEVLSGKENIRINSLSECSARTLVEGSARGELWGGNLSLIIERLGTEGQIDTKDKILLIEEVGEKLYAFDRMMLQLKNSGSLQGIRGLLFGEMTEMGDTKVPFGKDTDGIIMDVCGDLGVPIISNFPSGHGDYIATLPIGHEIEINAVDEPYLLIQESPVL